MNIEQLREFCLSFEGATEKTPFGKFARRFESILVFYVHDHMFCLCDMDNFSSVTVKGDPDQVAELLETRSACSSHRNMSKRFWVQIDFGADINDKEILDLISRSYEIVKHKYAPKSMKRTMSR